MTYNQAQLALWSDLRNLSRIEQELYHSRRHFRLKENELVHVSRRITLTFNDMVMTQDHDMDGELYEYETNREEEFYYHVWFNNWGHIWFLITDNAFPVFGKDIAHWANHDEYNDRSGRGSRYYFFSDVIEHAVLDAVQAQWNDLSCHYVWRFSEMEVFKYENQ